MKDDWKSWMQLVFKCEEFDVKAEIGFRRDTTEPLVKDRYYYFCVHCLDATLFLVIDVLIVTPDKNLNSIRFLLLRFGRTVSRLGISSNYSVVGEGTFEFWVFKTNRLGFITNGELSAPTKNKGDNGRREQISIKIVHTHTRRARGTWLNGQCRRSGFPRRRDHQRVVKPDGGQSENGIILFTSVFHVFFPHSKNRRKRPLLS